MNRWLVCVALACVDASACDRDDAASPLVVIIHFHTVGYVSVSFVTGAHEGTGTAPEREHIIAFCINRSARTSAGARP